MESLALVVVTSVGYWIAYRTYGRFLARRIFQLDDQRPVPSETLTDGSDYVPTRRGIVFGHHYTSIAGTGPIVGPAIGIIWGWVPALVWVFVGSIVMGAVHDFASLVMSLRNEGRNMSEIAGRYISSRARTIFFLVAFLELLIVIAIFGVVIATVFAMYPGSVLPIWLQIPISMALGLAIYRWKRNVTISTAVAVLSLYALVALGQYMPFTMPAQGLAGLPPVGVWVAILLVYAFIASVLPVRTLLQPRDYVNAWQLFIAMGLLTAGLLSVTFFGGGMPIVAPAFQAEPTGAPPIWPFLGVTIACGAISGFHCLVASGTTPKQLRCEGDAQFVGYGSMLLESALAVLVIVAVASAVGLGYTADLTGKDANYTGTAAWNHLYSAWFGYSGLGDKLCAVVIGATNMLQALGIPPAIGKVFIGVFIASFAGTTLDTATRIQRYVIAELAGQYKLRWVANKWIATLLAVASAAGLAFVTGTNGTGAMKLWPMFGATNQLLAALALLVATVYLKKQRVWHAKGYLLTGLPAVFMLVLTVWAMILNELRFIRAEDPIWALVIINAITLLLALGLAVETGRVLLTGTTEESSPPADPV